MNNKNLESGLIFGELLFPRTNPLCFQMSKPYCRRLVTTTSPLPWTWSDKQHYSILRWDVKGVSLRTPISLFNIILVKLISYSQLISLVIDILVSFTIDIPVLLCLFRNFRVRSFCIYLEIINPWTVSIQRARATINEKKFEFTKLFYSFSILKEVELAGTARKC